MLKMPVVVVRTCTWPAIETPGVQSWYDEVNDFKYGVGSINSGIVGYYTQVVSYRSDQYQIPNSSTSTSANTAHL
ncbi:cysteine-rich venom protein ENH2-like [Alosa alosa]|nr:cysteine-rich venom protein ENH2-like [Alosa alosa]